MAPPELFRNGTFCYSDVIFDFNFLDKPGSGFNSEENAELKEALQTAGRVLGSFLDHDATIRINVISTVKILSSLGKSSPVEFRLAFSDNPALSKDYIRKYITANEFQNDIEIVDYHGSIYVDSNFFKHYLVYRKHDQSYLGQLFSLVGMTVDPVLLFMHELVHGIGFQCSNYFDFEQEYCKHIVDSQKNPLYDPHGDCNIGMDCNLEGNLYFKTINDRMIPLYVNQFKADKRGDDVLNNLSHLDGRHPKLRGALMNAANPGFFINIDLTEYKLEMLKMELTEYELEILQTLGYKIKGSAESVNLKVSSR